IVLGVDDVDVIAALVGFQLRVNAVGDHSSSSISSSTSLSIIGATTSKPATMLVVIQPPSSQVAAKRAIVPAIFNMIDSSVWERWASAPGDVRLELADLDKGHDRLGVFAMPVVVAALAITTCGLAGGIEMNVVHVIAGRSGQIRAFGEF